MARPKVTLYTRAGCCLCDEAKRVLSDARRRADFDYEELDIDLDPSCAASTMTKCR
jgi:glutaredoxin